MRRRTTTVAVVERRYTRAGWPRFWENRAIDARRRAEQADDPNVVAAFLALAEEADAHADRWAEHMAADRDGFAPGRSQVDEAMRHAFRLERERAHR